MNYGADSSGDWASAAGSTANAVGTFFQSYYQSKAADSAAQAAGYNSAAAQAIAQAQESKGGISESTKTALIIGGVAVGLLVVGAMTWRSTRRR